MPHQEKKGDIRGAVMAEEPSDGPAKANERGSAHFKRKTGISALNSARKNFGVEEAMDLGN